jgi:hypothetical protein
VPFFPADLSRRRFKSVHRPTRSTLTTSRSSHWEKERRFTSLWISTGCRVTGRICRMFAGAKSSSSLRSTLRKEALSRQCFRRIGVNDWRHGIDLEDGEFRQSIITPEEAGSIRQRRLEKMREMSHLRSAPGESAAGVPRGDQQGCAVLRSRPRECCQEAGNEGGRPHEPALGPIRLAGPKRRRRVIGEDEHRPVLFS